VNNTYIHTYIHTYVQKTLTKRVQTKPKSRSQVYPEMYAQPLGAQRILSSMMSVHGEVFKTLPQRRTYDHTLYERFAEVTLGELSPEVEAQRSGDPQLTVPDKCLFDIVAAGLKSMRVAGDAVQDLRLELGLVTEYPVLVAADEYNCLHWPNCFNLLGESIPQDKMQLSTR
jgi:hypothetical protein